MCTTVLLHLFLSQSITLRQKSISVHWFFCTGPFGLTVLPLFQDDKKFYQLELVNREPGFNKVFNTNPNVGVINPLIKVRETQPHWSKSTSAVHINWIWSDRKKKKKAQTINLFKSTPSLQFMESMNIIKEYFKGYALWDVCFTEVPLEWDILQRLFIAFYCSFTFCCISCVCVVVIVCVLYPCSNISSTLLSKS